MTTVFWEPAAQVALRCGRGVGHHGVRSMLTQCDGSVNHDDLRAGPSAAGFCAMGGRWRDHACGSRRHPPRPSTAPASIWSAAVCIDQQAAPHGLPDIESGTRESAPREVGVSPLFSSLTSSRICCSRKLLRIEALTRCPARALRTGYCHHRGIGRTGAPAVPGCIGRPRVIRLWLFAQGWLTKNDGMPPPSRPIPAASLGSTQSIPPRAGLLKITQAECDS
jgi:hypothetical protein